MNGNGQLTDQDILPWCDALSYCENLSLAGHDDWRLPNIRELESIVDYGRPSPAIDPVFGGRVEQQTWSSTQLAGNPVTAWQVNFGFGGAGAVTEEDHDPAYFRAVRNAP